MTARILPHDWFPRPVPDNFELGERSWLYSSFAFLHYCSQRPRGVRVGKDTGLYHGTFFELGPEGEVEIGNYSSIVGAIFRTNGKIAVGDYVFISHEVVIADSEAPFPPDDRSKLAGATVQTGGEVVIDDDVWIGTQAVLLGSVYIGAGAVIGAATLVTEDVPPYAIFAGNPGRIVGYARPS